MHELSFCWPELPDIDIAPWLELLHSFVAVKDLVLSDVLIPGTLHILRRLTGEGVPSALPALLRVFGYFSGDQEVVAEFITARQLSGHPVVFIPITVSL
jgi:hypothetical protein